MALSTWEGWTFTKLLLSGREKEYDMLALMYVTANAQDNITITEQPFTTINMFLIYLVKSQRSHLAWEKWCTRTHIWIS